MLYKEHGGGVFLNQSFQLHSGINVNIVQRFVPEVQVCRLTDAFGKQHFLFLSLGIGLHRLFKQGTGKVHFPQYTEQQGQGKTALRGKFKAVGCEYKVYKNTLVRKAFRSMGVEAFDADLNGTTATIFCPDETSGLKIVADAVKADKNLEEKIVVKSAYVDGAYVDKAGADALAAIPPKEVLLARMVGSLQSSISKLVYVLDAIAKKQ